MAKKRVGNWLIGISMAVYLRIFPKKINFPGKVMDVIKTVYPTLDITSVSYYEGLPWFIDQGFAHAITLPGVYNLNRIHIYFSKADFSSRQGISTIIHECFHALQYQELYKSRGVGLFRIFMVHYLAEFFRLFFRYFPGKGFVRARQMAYNQHPMEIMAFEIDRKFQEFIDQNEGLFMQKVSIPGSLITGQTGHKYRAGKLPYWFSVLLLIILTILTPFIEFWLLIYSGVCLGLGKLFSVIGI